MKTLVSRPNQRLLRICKALIRNALHRSIRLEIAGRAAGQ
jgi:hypothetical protein